MKLHRLSLRFLSVGVFILSSPCSVFAQRHLDHTPNTNFLECTAPYPLIVSGVANDGAGYLPNYPSQGVQLGVLHTDVHSMITREGVWTRTLDASLSTCVNYTHDWWGGSEEIFETWWEPTAYLGTNTDCPVPPPGFSVGGCTGYDYLWSGTTSILAADTVLPTDNDWHVINQDSLRDYMNEDCMDMEQIYLHEVGHKYGLDHYDANITIMNTVGACQRNYNLARASGNFFWPNDNAQMRARGEVATGSSTRKNYTASIWFRNTQSKVVRDTMRTDAVPAAGNFGESITYSLERFFTASTAALYVQFRWVPQTSTPSFNATTHVWTWPTNTSTDTWDYDVVPTGTADTTTRRTYNIVMTRADFPAAATIYRLWMFVDPLGIHAETDEGDNMIPTPIFVSTP